jgi:riboflavin-specific deaminase-like protein
MDFIRSVLVTAADHRQSTGRPFVTLSYAQSLDGCISGRPGEALALSGRRSLILTHRLRAGHDAILVGIGTVFSDNPRLNVRLVNGSSPRPIVVDTRLRIPLDCKLLTENSRGLWVITGEHPDQDKRKAIEALGAHVVCLPCEPSGLVKLDVMLERLGELGVNSVMVEGGSRIITNFLMKRLANSVVLTVAPVLLNGLRGVRDLGLANLEHSLRLRNPGHRRLGEDIILWGDLA